MPRVHGVLHALALGIQATVDALDMGHPSGPELPQPVPPTPETTGWTHEVRPGAFVTAISSARLLVGPELIMRHERVIDDHRRCFINDEAWGDSGDPRHCIHLVTAGASMHSITHIAVDPSVRANEESRPRDVETTVAGCHRLSIRQDCVLGLTTTS